jgi:predicted 3-demethylubiquinone-9 3-methyltransferase (glyoxalase superfamily)
VNCESQEEVDYFWEKLSAGGPGSGVRLVEGQVRTFVASDTDEAAGVHQGPRSGKADRVMAAMMTMKKIDIAALDRAYEGK